MTRQMQYAAFTLIGALLALSACDSSPQQASAKGDAGKKPQVVQVGVVNLKSQAVPYTSQLPGRVDAYRTAEIRPQVDGIILKRVFKEGHEVKAGEVLYRLDSTRFEAARDAAQAAVEKAAAGVANAQGKYERTEKLGQSNAVSTQSVDDAHSTLLQAQADLASAKADLQTARINLDNATIRAPISGLIGKSTVSDGALVTANQTTALATIRQLDPIYVDMVDSAANLLRIRGMVKSGDLGHDRNGPPTVELQLDDGSTYEETGKMDLAEVNVSQSTGTFSLRAEFTNPHRILLPGMFVRATISLGKTPNAYLVPEQAVTHDGAGDATVFVVGADSKIETRKLTTGRIHDNAWVVTAGLKPADRIVVDGLQYISNGTTVSPVDVNVNKDGTVEEVASAKSQKTSKDKDAGKATATQGPAGAKDAAR